MIVPFGHVLILAGSSSHWASLSGHPSKPDHDLIGVEVMMNAALIAFVAASLRWHLMEGQAFMLFIIAVAGAEVSVGLALVVSVYRKTGSLDPDRYDILKW